MTKDLASPYAWFACVSLTREERRPQSLGVWVVTWPGDMREASARIGLVHGKLASQLAS